MQETLSDVEARLLRQAIDELSYVQRTVLLLKEHEKLSYAQIAERLDIRLDAVPPIIHSARRLLIERMKL